MITACNVCGSTTGRGAVNFGTGANGSEEYPARYYRQFLEYVKERYAGEYWHVLPREMARLFRPEFKPRSCSQENSPWQSENIAVPPGRNFNGRREHALS